MNRTKAFAIGSCLGLLAMGFLPSLKADEWEQKTKLTLNESVAIPGKVLQPGEYWLRLADTPSNRNIVQVWNSDQTDLIAEIATVPTYRLVPAGDNRLAFWEQPVGQSPALKTWYYPGENFGHEFAYPKGMATQIAQAPSCQPEFQAGATAVPSPPSCTCPPAGQEAQQAPPPSTMACPPEPTVTTPQAQAAPETTVTPPTATACPPATTITPQAQAVPQTPQATTIQPGQGVEVIVPPPQPEQQPAPSVQAQEAAPPVQAAPPAATCPPPAAPPPAATCPPPATPEVHEQPMTTPEVQEAPEPPPPQVQTAPEPAPPACTCPGTSSVQEAPQTTVIVPENGSATAPSVTNACPDSSATPDTDEQSPDMSTVLPAAAAASAQA